MLIVCVVLTLLCILILLQLNWSFLFTNKQPNTNFQNLIENNDKHDIDITRYNNIPKIIWTFWDTEHVPEIIKKCIRGWQKHNPDYKIIVLNKQNYIHYVNIPEYIVNHPHYNDNHAHFADMIRIHVLSANGGVWVDSSIILNDSLDKWLFPHYGEFSGFYISSFTTKPEYPVIENWFFACNKGSKFMKLWRDEYVQISKYNSVKDYIDSRTIMGVDIQNISSPIYLAMHVSAQKVLQIDQYPITNLILRKAEDGPFRYLSSTEWKTQRALYLACKEPAYTRPLLKLRGCDRKILEDRSMFNVLLSVNIDNLLH